MRDAVATVRHVSLTKARQVPVDMVTQRMMVQGPRPSAPNAHQYKSGIEAIRRIARSEGILGAPASLRRLYYAQWPQCALLLQ